MNWRRQRILQLASDQGSIDSSRFAKVLKSPHPSYVSALFRRLANEGLLERVDTVRSGLRVYRITDDGTQELQQVLDREKRPPGQHRSAARALSKALGYQPQRRSL